MNLEMESIGGRRCFSLMGEESGILDYEQGILSEGNCPHVLAVTFMEVEGRGRLSYDATGHCSLAEYIESVSIKSNHHGEERIHADDVLSILLNTLQAVKNCEDYLLPAERIPLAMDTVFMDVQTKKISFAYVPDLTGDCAFQERFIRLAEEMDNLFDSGELSSHISSLGTRITEKNPGIDGIISMVAAIQREINFNYWERQGLRRAGISGIHDRQEGEEKEEGEEEELLEKGQDVEMNPWFKGRKKTFLLVQVMIAMALAAIYGFKVLEGMDFFGFLFIVMGIDAWLMKSIK